MNNEQDSADTNLSMIDCGIKSLKDIPLKYNLTSINLHSNQISKIENLTYLQHLKYLDLSSNKITKIYGLHGLVSLTKLNLSCNQIQSIENLDGLKKLKYLNLSYNKIQYISGLNDLWGTDYSLEILVLNSNFISSIEEFSYYLTGLTSLKHLTLNDNKFLNTIDYRPFIFKNVKQLVSLDGRDKTNKIVNYKTSKNTYLDEFIDLKKTSKPNSPKLKRPNVQIFEDEEDESVSSLGPKLDQIEDKIHKLLFIRDKIKNQDEHFDRIISRPIQKPLVSILKSPQHSNQSTSTNDITSNDDSTTTTTNSTNLNELIKTLQEQLVNYKNTQDINQNLVNELKKKLEDCCTENLKKIQEKDDLIRKESDLNKELNSQNEKLKLKLDQVEAKLKQFEIETATQSARKEEKIKFVFQNEFKNLKEKNERLLKEKLDKISELENSYKQLEDEFRSALVIESNRYNELFKKYETNSLEINKLKSSLKIAEENEARNKSLINELNELIKEQKNRIQLLTKVRKETSEDIQKRNEKLSEAVADCVKLKTQCEQLKKEKNLIETNLKKICIEFDSIKKEKFQWTQKLNDQKNFFLHENNRLETENKQFKSDLDQLNSQLHKEIDNCKIKSKIIEDQTETIKKLKNALTERDDMIKTSREEALNIQKKLEKQLNDEMDMSNELQIKLDKSNEKKGALKIEIGGLKTNLDETKQAYDELAEKWKQKSELINELDIKVRKMKENFDLKEKSLIDANEKLKQENEFLNGRLRKIDDDFRQQYDSEKKEHLKHIEKIKNENLITINKYETKIKELEDEMRLILIDCENKKKFYDEKINSFTDMFSKFKADLKTNN